VNQLPFSFLGDAIAMPTPNPPTAGGQFLRAVVQRCQHLGPRMHTLVTLGSQHQGVMDVPGCWQPSLNGSQGVWCGAMQALLGRGAYLPWVQRRVVQVRVRACMRVSVQNVLFCS
jgi:hypothetical protein